jgi:hypothetical protein
VQDTLGGLQTTLDTTAKLNSANTFTGLQTINGDLKVDYVLVKNTTPTLTTHLTSKLYVDTALNGKQNTLLAGDNITITNNTISSTGGGGGGGLTQADLDTKQDIINDGDLSFAKTAGLQSLINAQDKLASRIYVDNELNKKQKYFTCR